MSSGAIALSSISSPAAGEGEYEAILAALTESARGRAFLDEFARRNRSADTRAVLSALARLEQAARSNREAALHDELVRLACTLAQARAAVAPARSRLPISGQPTEAAAAAAADVRDTAERLQEVVWTMRERGIDPAICDEIASLAARIPSSLSEGNDARTRRLSDVLHSLEQRVAVMLAAYSEPNEQATSAVPQLTPEPEAPQSDERRYEPAASTMPSVPASSSPAAERSAVEGAPHPMRGDPLAVLCTFSAEELIALFT